MRHLKSGSKLGRKADHRNAMIANLACSVIKHKRVTTTVAKAKAVRPVVEKLITLGRHAIGASKADNVHLRRLAASKLLNKMLENRKQINETNILKKLRQNKEINDGKVDPKK